MPQAIAFAALSLVLAGVFRDSLRRPRSHGFYRFFAMEAVLALLLLNGPYWWVDRFAPHQIASWVVLFASLGLLIPGCITLHRHGKADADARDDPALLGFEKTRRLVTQGIYAQVRHPLYSSLMLLAWGVYLKQPGVMLLVLPVFASVFLYITARIEEHECLAFFGDAYREYMQRTWRFIPWMM